MTKRRPLIEVVFATTFTTTQRSSPCPIQTPPRLQSRTLLARSIFETGWSLRRAAGRFQVSTGTANRWTTHYREHVTAGIYKRFSPHRT